MNETQNETQDEALSRATQNQSVANYPAIFEGFMALGILENDIKPRENVFTYQAWRALGRQVRKGEHGIRVFTYVPMTKKTTDDDGNETREDIGRKPKSTTVFHVSQTEAIQ